MEYVNIVLIVLMCACLLGIVFSIMMLVRNEIVYKVRTRLLWDDYRSYANLPTYDEMMHQFTKCKYEHWAKEIRK